MEAPNNDDPVAVANQCLAGGEPMVVLRMHQFEDDFEAHDNELQDELGEEFEAAFAKAFEALSAVFGAGTELPQDDEDGDSGLPVAGVFLAAEWNVRGQRLYLAAAHEDRETPFLLVLGVES